MHGSKCELSHLPVFMLAFIHHDSLVLLKISFRCGQINLDPLEARITDIDNIDRLTGGKHGCKSLATFAGSCHLLLCALYAVACLVHGGLALNRENFFFNHFTSFFWQLGKMVVFD